MLSLVRFFPRRRRASAWVSVRIPFRYNLVRGWVRIRGLLARDDLVRCVFFWFRHRNAQLLLLRHLATFICDDIHVFRKVRGCIGSVICRLSELFIVKEEDKDGIDAVIYDGGHGLKHKQDDNNANYIDKEPICDNIPRIRIATTEYVWITNYKREKCRNHKNEYFSEGGWNRLNVLEYYCCEDVSQQQEEGVLAGLNEAVPRNGCDDVCTCTDEDDEAFETDEKTHQTAAQAC